MKWYDQVINATLMIVSIVAANKIVLMLIQALHLSVEQYQKMAGMLFVAISIYMCIKLLTLIGYLLISIPVLICCIWKKGLYTRYSNWLTYRTSFRVLYLL